MIEGIEDKEIREIARSLYYEGRTTEEIAEARNITHGTLRRKLFEYRKGIKSKK